MKGVEDIFWTRLLIFNFLILALVGVIMRYKMCYELPFFDQKHLQLAHSNFAFVGWITQALFILMVRFLKEYQQDKNKVFYQKVLLANVLSAYGLFFSFATQGYGFISIGFSTLTVIIGIVFAIQFNRDVKLIPKTMSVLWFRAALFFMVISSLGTFSLAYMMASKHIVQHEYLASIYWYLHFQYNGWFFFASIGLLLNAIVQYGVPSSKHPITFYLFGISCLVTYLLSVLWLNLSLGWLVIAFVAAAIQLWAWFRLLLSIKEPLFLYIKSKTPILKYILLLLAIALTIKFILQLGSTIPIVSKLAFGFRPVVIAYLHLVLLAIISVYLIVFMLFLNTKVNSKFSIIAIVLFVITVYCNQLVLGMQGVASFANYYFNYMNEVLLVIAISILLSLFLVFLSSLKKPLLPST